MNGLTIFPQGIIMCPSTSIRRDKSRCKTYFFTHFYPIFERIFFLLRCANSLNEYERILCLTILGIKNPLLVSLLGCKRYISELKDIDVAEMIKHLYGINICICKHCGSKMEYTKRILPMRCWIQINTYDKKPLKKRFICCA